jgi:transcriptional regulator with XRE-family HTH domain
MHYSPYRSAAWDAETAVAREITKLDLDENKVDQRVGENVRRIRILRRLSQEKLALTVGVTFQQIQKYEKGINRISASRLVQFSIVLSCSLEDLFEGAKDDAVIVDTEVSRPSTEATKVALQFDRITDGYIRKKIAGLISTLADGGEAA